MVVKEISVHVIAVLVVVQNKMLVIFCKACSFIVIISEVFDHCALYQTK